MAVLKHSLGAALLALVALVAAPGAAGAQVAASEYDVKAAFLFNFTKFVEWPDAAFAEGRGAFLICVEGDDPFGRSLRQAVTGEEVAGRKIMVVSKESLNDPSGCEVLFVSRSESSRAPQILSAVRDEPVLTVGDARGFLEQGGIINFVMEGNKVRFEINQESAERAGLQISSKLLRLAVRTAPGAKPEP